MKIKQYIPYKNITFCCIDCGTMIFWTNALYGNGRCKICHFKFITGRKLSLEHRLKLSLAKKGKYIGKNHPMFGKHHSKESKLKMSKSLKGKKLSKEHKLKISKTLRGIKRSVEHCEKIGYSHKGKKCNFYIHGNGYAPYPIMFKDTLKENIRERDTFICQGCGLKEQNHYRGNNQTNLSVHHIDFNKQNCDVSNLITLCIGCNLKANTEPDYWVPYYQYIMEHFIKN
jgi:hypothetical protein